MAGDMTENLSSGFECGCNWSLDHDLTTGTITVTVSGTLTPGRTLTLHAQVINKTNQAIVWERQLDIGQFTNQGPQTLFGPSTQIQGITLANVEQGNPSFETKVWTTCA